MLLSRLSPSFAVLSAVLLAASAPAAQTVVVDDFDNGIGPNEFVFGGGEFGALGAFDEGGGDLSAEFRVDADEYGGFTGFGQPIEGGPLDLTGFDQPVLAFDLDAQGTFTLEINFQNTGGGGEGELRNALRFTLGPGNADGGFRTYRIPLSTFFPTNAASFELDDVFQYVCTILDAVGDGDTNTQETGIYINNVRVEEGLSFVTAAEANGFDDGDFADTNGYFYFAGGEGIVAAATTDTPDGSANAFSGALDGDDYGGFAGFGRTLAAAPVDATGFETINFYLRANGSAVMEFNLQTNAAAGGNEGRERIVVSDTDGAWVPVSLPIRAFIQSSATPPDFSQVYNFVVTIVELQGDGDSNTTEFEFEIDGIGFGSAVGVAVDELPEAFAAAPSVFPNPTAGGATVAFELAAPSDVAVDVIDLLGRRVAEAASGPRAAGPVRLAVPTGDLPSGVYVVRVRTDAGVASTRLTVVR